MQSPVGARPFSIFADTVLLVSSREPDTPATLLAPRPQDNGRVDQAPLIEIVISLRKVH